VHWETRLTMALKFASRVLQRPVGRRALVEPRIGVDSDNAREDFYSSDLEFSAPASLVKRSAFKCSVCLRIATARASYWGAAFPAAARGLLA
jgi:hypothetical protein